MSNNNIIIEKKYSIGKKNRKQLLSEIKKNKIEKTQIQIKNICYNDINKRKNKLNIIDKINLFFIKIYTYLYVKFLMLEKKISEEN